MRWLQSLRPRLSRRKLHHHGSCRKRSAIPTLGAKSLSKLLIQNGTLVTADQTYRSDILIDGSRIREIAESIPVNAADRVINAEGTYVMPGGIDVHTHMDMPFGG